MGTKNNEDTVRYPHLSREMLLKILDNAYDEIYVTDSDRMVIYANNAVKRHYGMEPSEHMGKNVYDLVDGNWNPTMVPVVYEDKRRIAYEQVFYKTGQKVITTAVPLLDEKGEVDIVVFSVRDKLNAINAIDVRYGSKGKIGEEEEKEEEKNTSIIYKSKKMAKTLCTAKKFANTDSNILILGESGTGKNVLANYIHDYSNREPYPFITINCAAIPENLMESELFGYTGGAFTGANPKGKRGLIEVADKGTLFLDEIGELALPLQAKLLQVIQSKQFIPVGGYEAKTVNVRIIAATNQDLSQLVQDKLFREDLFWRLSIMEIVIPSLRERPEDILLLSYYFLHVYNKKYELDREFSDECQDAFMEYSWKGNVRQLENVIERLVVLSEKPTIEVDNLPKNILDDVKRYDGAYTQVVGEFEKDIVQKAYKENPSTRKLAKALNISQSKATRLINKYCKCSRKV